VYQESNGIRTPVVGAYVLKDDNKVGFHIPDYDRRRPLVIDPIVYTTYIGGTGNEEALSRATGRPQVGARDRGGGFVPHHRHEMSVVAVVSRATIRTRHDGQHPILVVIVRDPPTLVILDANHACTIVI
jgi:hypothetical protein